MLHAVLSRLCAASVRSVASPFMIRAARVALAVTVAWTVPRALADAQPNNLALEGDSPHLIVAAFPRQKGRRMDACPPPCPRALWAGAYAESLSNTNWVPCHLTSDIIFKSPYVLGSRVAYRASIYPVRPLSLHLSLAGAAPCSRGSCSRRCIARTALKAWLGWS